MQHFFFILHDQLCMNSLYIDDYLGKKKKNIIIQYLYYYYLYKKNFVLLYIHVTYLNMQSWIRQPFIWVRSEIKYLKVFRMKMAPCQEAYIPTKSGPNEQYWRVFFFSLLKEAFFCSFQEHIASFELTWIHIASNSWPKSRSYSIQLVSCIFHLLACHILLGTEKITRVELLGWIKTMSRPWVAGLRSIKL